MIDRYKKPRFFKTGLFFVILTEKIGLFDDSAYHSIEIHYSMKFLS